MSILGYERVPSRLRFHRRGQMETEDAKNRLPHDMSWSTRVWKTVVAQLQGFALRRSKQTIKDFQ